MNRDLARPFTRWLQFALGTSSRTKMDIVSPSVATSSPVLERFRKDTWRQQKRRRDELRGGGEFRIPRRPEKDDDDLDLRQLPTDGKTRTEKGVSVDGKFLRVNGQRFWVKGVTYGTFCPNDQGEPYPPLGQLKEDFARMREAGINTIRLYTPPSDRIADAAAEAGLYLVPDICWGSRRCELDHPERVKLMFDWTREHARRLAGHPAILMFSIGNEIPPLLVRWYGRERIERLLRELFETAKEQAAKTLVTYVNHPPTEYLHLPFLDVVSFNIYLEREPEFRAYLSRLQTLAGDRPLFLAELGLDENSHGPLNQACSLDWQLRAVFEKGLCGAAVYGWTDDWGIFDSQIEGWAFGLTRSDRSPKMSLAAVSHVYHASHCRLRKERKPQASVVVCAHNASATLSKCLRSLALLHYPNYEVIVVDDGSTDGTQAIAQEYGMRCIRVPNGGLSRARNLGIEAANGEIIAFIDADAYADPEWLYFLVTTLEEHGAAAVGGPNLSPSEDGFVAKCVDHAPGNPTHVLIDNEHAEHIPGCNMAFRKSALKSIGLFDPTHRAAGDDVDVCWKLLVRGKKIVFSPSAVVWHHRRATVRAFFRQQKGYGYAEAHLQQRYPGRFNLFGYPVWRGGIYDGVHTGLRREGLPVLFRSRVYQGQFGSAQFQSVYQPFLTWWFQVFTTIEWQTTMVCVLLAGLLGLFSSLAVSIGPLLLAAAMFGATIGAASVAGVHAVRAKKWSGFDKLRAGSLVAYLHIAQPIARAWGRIQGLRHSRTTGVEFPSVQRLYGNLSQRDRWLHGLLAHLHACGWVARPSCSWGEGDIDILGPGPYALQLCSLYEENLERGQHYVRYRITARMKPWLPVCVGGLALLLPIFVLLPHLLPLGIPTIGLLTCFLRARRNMIRAVSQLAMEVGEPLRMTRVGEEYRP